MNILVATLYNRIIEHTEQYWFRSAKDWELFRKVIREVLKGDISPSEEDFVIPTIQYTPMICPKCHKDIVVPLVVRKLKDIQEIFHELKIKKNVLDTQITYLAEAMDDAEP